jgi:FkbM family methyltransferase
MANRGAAVRIWLDGRKVKDNASRQREVDDLLKSGAVDLLLDLGAHVGEQTLPASEYVPVIAFEPDPVAAAQIRALIASRATQFPIMLHEAAAWDSEGSLSLWGHKRGITTTGSSSLMANKRNVQGGVTYKVPTVDIGSFVEGLPHRSILVKCDVEGAEYRVPSSLLQGRRLDRLVAVYTEFDDEKIPGAWARSIALSLRLAFRRVHRASYLREWI